MGDRAPPADIKLHLRREAGFGCCVCGLPIIQYHHIIPWAEEQHFRPEDMMVLCPTHHDQATKGAMLEREQRKHKAKPRNILLGYAQGLLKVNQPLSAIRIGSNLLYGEGTLLSVDDEPLLSLFMGDDDNLEISLRLHGEDGTLLVEIDRNEWKTGNALPWDIQADWQKLRIREGARQMALMLDCTSLPFAIAGRLQQRGAVFNMTPTRLIIDWVSNPAPGEFVGLAFIACAINLDTQNRERTLRPQVPDEGCWFGNPNDAEKHWTSVWKERVARRDRAAA